MISDTERKQLLSVMQSGHWGLIEQMAERLKQTIREEETEYSSEWHAVKDTLLKQGQVRGIDRLFKELYNEATHDSGRENNTNS